MKNKVKENSFLLNFLKGTFVALIVSLIGILIFAFVLKMLNVSDGLIAPVNQIIKILSIFIGVTVALKKNKQKGLLTGLLVGLIYTLLAFLVFSILNGTFNLDKSLFNDVLFGSISGAICGIISITIKGKKHA